MKKTTASIKVRVGSYEKKINKPQPDSRKKGRGLNKIRNEKGEITTDTVERQRITRDYLKQPYAYKMDKLEEMDRFLERDNLPRLNQEELENINRPIASNAIETNEKSSNKQKSRTRWLHR